jgi:hypothetical protein
MPNTNTKRKDMFETTPNGLWVHRTDHDGTQVCVFIPRNDLAKLAAAVAEKRVIKLEYGVHDRF